MNKKMIVLLSIIVLVILVGSAFSYIFINNQNKNNFENRPNLKILAFKSSLNPTEAYSTPLQLPWSNSMYLYYPPPVFNFSLFSTSSANFELLITLLNGTTLDLMAEPFIGYVNISYPNSISNILEIISIFKNSGNYTLTLKVFENSTIVEKTLTEIVLPKVTISGINGPTKMEINSNASYTPEKIIGGKSPYKYIWYIQFINNSYGYKYWEEYLNYSGENLTFKPTLMTNYKISLYVIDNLGRASVFSLPLNVSNKLSSSISSKFDPVDVGVNDIFYAELTGGFPNFTYEWNIYPLNISIKNQSSFNYTFVTPGKYIISLKVLDSINDITNSTLNVTVNKYPKIINFTQEYNAVDYNIYDCYYLNVTGGTLKSNEIYISYYSNGSLDFNMTLNNMSKIAKAFYSLFWVEYTPPPFLNQPLTSIITVKIMDYGGAVLSYNFTLTVNPPIQGSIIITPNTNISVGDEVYLNASISGGTAPYNFTWEITCPNFTEIMLYGQDISIKASQSGYYDVELTLTDMFGFKSLYSYTYIYSGFTVGGS